MKRVFQKPKIYGILAVLSWLHTVLFFSGVYLMTAAVLRMETAEAAVYLSGCVWLAVPTVLSWYLARTARALWVYLLASAFVSMLIFLLRGPDVTFFLSIVIFFLRCAARIKKGDHSYVVAFPHPLHLTVFLLYYLWALLLGAYDQLRWILFLAVMDIFLCFVYHYLLGTADYIEQKREMGALPVETIKKVRRFILAALILLLGIFVLPALLCKKEPLISAVEYLKNGASAVDGDFSMDLMQPYGVWEDWKNPYFDDTPGKMSPQFQALSMLLTYIAVAAAVVVMLLLLWNLWKSIAAHFSQQEDEVTFLDAKTREESGMRMRSKSTQRERRGSPNQRIRRYYKKILKKSMTGLPSGWETPRELEQRAKMNADEQTERLHGLYEKARYSETGCTREDAKTLTRHG